MGWFIDKEKLVGTKTFKLVFCIKQQGLKI